MGSCSFWTILYVDLLPHFSVPACTVRVVSCPGYGERAPEAVLIFHKSVPSLRTSQKVVFAIFSLDFSKIEVI